MNPSHISESSWREMFAPCSLLLHAMLRMTFIPAFVGLDLVAPSGVSRSSRQRTSPALKAPGVLDGPYRIHLRGGFQVLEDHVSRKLIDACERHGPGFSDGLQVHVLSAIQDLKGIDRPMDKVKPPLQLPTDLARASCHSCLT